MDAPIVQQTVITPQLATAASMLIRMAHPQNQSLHRALARAEERLISQPWRIDAGILRIVSFSRQNETYRTDGDYCECVTKRGVCWHRAAWMICSTLAAAGCYVVADLPLPSVLEDDDLPGDFLDSLPDEDTFGGTVEGWDSYGDVITAAGAFEEVDELPAPARRVRETFTEPFRPTCREIVPEPGSELARLQARANELCAA